MAKLLIATTNPGKLGEIKRFLADLPLELASLIEVGIKEKVEETGKTFEENAILKVRFYAEKSGLPTLADDGGLEIDALGGKPGVKSHRWIDGTKDDEDEDLIAYTLEKMKGLPSAKREAQLRLVFALVIGGKIHTAEGVVRGFIPEMPSSIRHPGFPFRSLLFLPQLGKFYNHDELTPEEDERYNHRKKALEKLKPILKNYARH